VDSLSLLKNVLNFATLKLRNFLYQENWPSSFTGPLCPGSWAEGRMRENFKYPWLEGSRNLEIAVVEPMEPRNTLWDQCLGL
jgi:hypothetical protein